MPPPAGKMPTFVSVRPISARGSMTRKWQPSASSQPPPKATPFSAAIVGLPASSRSSVSWNFSRPLSIVSPPEPGFTSPRKADARSAPPENAFSPAPVMMMTRTVGSAWAAVAAWVSSSMVCARKALTLGRSSVMTAVAPSRLTLRSS